MTRPSTHIWRLLKWGRALARHGALRGIERDPNTPQPVKRLCRIARLGTIGCCRDTIIRLGALDLAPSTLEKGPQ